MASAPPLVKTRTPALNPVPERVIEGIWDRIQVEDWWDCWLWQLSPGSHGYGQMGWENDQGKSAGTTAHRVAWMAIHGDIPTGMTVDHECRNHMCCNPLHLRLLSNVANATDNGQGAKTHCPRGHAYDGENLYVDPKGHRRCKACAAITAERRKAKG